jgi:uncharacterized protein (DUF1778 family)
MSATRTARLEVRISEELAGLVQRAADIRGVTKSGFISSILQREAEQVVEEHEIIRLSLSDQQRFAEAIIDPPEPNAALRKAFERRKELLGVD